MGREVVLALLILVSANWEFEVQDVPSDLGADL